MTEDELRHFLDRVRESGCNIGRLLEGAASSSAFLETSTAKSWMKDSTYVWTMSAFDQKQPFVMFCLRVVQHRNKILHFGGMALGLRA